MLEIFHQYGKTPPLTSIRRAFSDLTSDGELVMTSFKIKGSFHLEEHTWMLKEGNEEEDVNKQQIGVGIGKHVEKIIEHSVNKTYVQPMLFRDNANE